MFAPKILFLQRRVTFEIDLCTGMRKMHFLIKKSFFSGFIEDQLDQRLFLISVVGWLVVNFPRKEGNF